MSDDLKLAQVMLKGSGVTVLEAARFILQILDALPQGGALGARAFCAKVIQAGLNHAQINEQRVDVGFELYVQTKAHLRPDSLRDIKYLGKRLLRLCPELAGRHFSELRRSDCERWLERAFTTASQFNKGRALLHALVEFAMKQEWCERNVVKLIAKKRVMEQEIKSLSIPETKRLLKESQRTENASCAAGVGLLLWAGLRPTELRRLRWSDIDINEKVITVRAQCSKTGGVRQVDIAPPLLRCLKRYQQTNAQPICPEDWLKKWKSIRDSAGFKGQWVQDVLRHTYASYHAKRYKNMPLLQLNMGHRDQSLLRARYVNMQGISRQEAERFFS